LLMNPYTWSRSFPVAVVVTAPATMSILIIIVAIVQCE
jgi:hypothetical protein